ncbi:hypothetical protein [Paraburkholderia adhaesiva]|uniref:hypothetical protein n=1 Tax=Paraburkholderia adhaesiva TaxID=2883244 RepID=UPI001F188E21|nr:hypothetical protein [Paraburkholderia adhaesiva]
MNTPASVTQNLAPLAAAQADPDELNSLRQRALAAIAAIRADPTSNAPMVDFLLNQAQSQTNDLINGDANSSPVHHILANLKSLLLNAQLVPTASSGLVMSSVSDEGDLVGYAKYELLDIGWTEAAVCWLEHFPASQKASFPNKPPVIVVVN